MLYAFRLSQAAQHCADIGVEQNGLLFKSSHGDGLAQIDAGVGGFGILHCHTQERHFNDAGGIPATIPYRRITVGAWIRHIFGGVNYIYCPYFKT